VAVVAAPVSRVEEPEPEFTAGPEAGTLCDKVIVGAEPGGVAATNRAPALAFDVGLVTIAVDGITVVVGEGEATPSVVGPETLSAETPAVSETVEFD
jgi:hypothetical protein